MHSVELSRDELSQLLSAPATPNVSRASLPEVVENLGGEGLLDPPRNSSLRALRRLRNEENEEAEAPTTLSVGVLKRLLVAGIAVMALSCTVWKTTSYQDTIGWHQGRSSSKSFLVSVPGATTMRWLAHPSKCLDVAGVSPGAGLQIWECDPSYPRQQEFLVPPDGTTGHIKWARHPTLCLDNPRNLELQFWHCEGSPDEHTQWIISPDGKGRIHLASKPALCVDVPEERQDNGWKLQVWPCHNYSVGGKDEDMRFITHPVDCEWEHWQDWGPCSVSCGGGMRVRSRDVAKEAINGGKECGIESDATEVCASTDCPTSEVTFDESSSTPSPDAFSAELVAAGKNKNSAARAPTSLLTWAACLPLLAACWAA